MIDGGAWDVKDGELVIVQRSKFQGAMIETTAKRVRKNGDFELWPESTHPDFQEPLRVQNRLEQGTDEEGEDPRQGDQHHTSSLKFSPNKLLPDPAVRRDCSIVAVWNDGYADKGGHSPQLHGK